jgi:hypothetical protein
MKKFVKVNTDRQWTPGLYEVISRQGHSHGATLKLRLAGTKNAGQDLYEAHTFTDADCFRANKAYAEQIGRTK